MRIFNVPSRYRNILEGSISRAVEEIRLDEFRREHGEKPMIDDCFLSDDDKKLDAFVVVGVATDRLLDAVASAAEKAGARRTRRQSA